jgi:hypothetical protein
VRPEVAIYACKSEESVIKGLTVHVPGKEDIRDPTSTIRTVRENDVWGAEAAE